MQQETQLFFFMAVITCNPLGLLFKEIEILKIIIILVATTLHFCFHQNICQTWFQKTEKLEIDCITVLTPEIDCITPVVTFVYVLQEQ